MSEYELGTFCGVPRGNLDDVADVAVLGIPYDVGSNPYRIGCRLGPDHIRRSYHPDRRLLFHSDRMPFDELSIVDCGNVPVLPGQPEASYATVEDALRRLFATGTVPLTFGGDGAVTLPQLRAANACYEGLAVIHCDAHTDSWDVDGAGPFTTTTTFLRAAQEGLVLPELVYHIGPRGTLGSAAGTAADVAATGQQVITTDAFCRRGPEEVAAELVETLGHRPIYLCWDMDFFDPAAAPGVATPEWGGPSTREALDFLRGLQALNLIACDINTVSPPHDVANLTGNLAARVAIEFLHTIAKRRRDTAPRQQVPTS